MARSMNTYNTLISGFTGAQYADTVSRMSGVLRAALSRSGDTGQVNWAGISTTAGTNVVRDFEVFAFTDSLQASKPIYIRIDWGISGISFYAQLHVGTATNGAGQLSGIQSGVYPGAVGTGTLGVTAGYQQFINVTSSTVLPRYCYASSDGSYLMFIMNAQQAGAAGTTGDSLGGFVVERTRDIDGTPNGNGYTVFRWLAAADSVGVGNNSFAGVNQRTYDTSQANPYQSATTFDFGAATTPGPGTTTIPQGGAAQAFGVYGSGPQPQGASKALALAYMADVPRMNQVTLNHYGAATQWISCGAGQPAVVATSAGVGTVAARTVFCPVFRWE